MGSYRDIARSFLEDKRRKYGQAFEKFYRVKLNEKEPERLRVLFEEPLLQVTETSADGLKDKEYRLNLETRALKLTDHLFQLAASVWESNIHVYLKAIDDISLDLLAEDRYWFMKRVHALFGKKYSQLLRERGESPDLTDQIVKRCGENNREQLDKVLYPLHPLAFTKELFFLLTSEAEHAKESAIEWLLELTDHEIREVRLTFTDLPAQLLAEQLYRCIQPWNQTETDEEQAERALEYDSESIFRILQGRSIHERKRILDEFHENLSKKGISSTPREILEHILSPGDFEAMQIILEDEELTSTTRFIAELFEEQNEFPPAPPLYAAECGLPPLQEPLSRILWQRARHADPTQNRNLIGETNCRLAIERSTLLFSRENFLKLRSLCQEQYGITLSPELYRQVTPLTPEEVAEELCSLLTLPLPQPFLLRGIEGLNPFAMREVRIAFRRLAATDLEDALLERRSPAVEEAADRVKCLRLHHSATGLLRATFGEDLLKILLEHDEPRSSDTSPLPILREKSWEIFELIVQSSAYQVRAGAQLLAHFQRSYEELVQVEESYTRMFGSLRVHLKSLFQEGLLAPEELCALILRLEGLEETVFDDIEIAIGELDDSGLQNLFYNLQHHCRTLEELFPLLNDGESLNSVITEMDISTERANKTILYFLGFYPDKVAELLQKVLSKSASADETERILRKIFQDPFSEETQNPLLPKDFNWITEMYIQVRLEFKALAGKSLLSAIIESGASQEIIDRLKDQLFGTDVVGVADKLHKFLKKKLLPEAAVRFSNDWKEYPSRYRDGVIELYNDLFPSSPLTPEQSRAL